MPTLNKLEYLDETKHLIKDALNTDFNTGITDEDTFRSYVDKIKNIYTNWPKLTIEGTNFNTLFTKKGKMVLQPNGNTQQITYTGKNLFDINSVASVTNGSISNQIITSDETSATNYSVYPYFSNISLSSGTYYLSMDIRIKTGTGTFNKINDSAIEWTEVSKPTISSNFQRYVYSHTYTENTSLNHILIQFINSTNAIYEIKNIMLSTSSDTTYEPYVGEIPSPNPSYPQPVKVVTGDNTIKVSDGTNTDNYSLNLGTIELCKIGDYKDYIYKENDKWYKHSEIGKVDLSTITWSSAGAGTSGYRRYYTNTIPNIKYVSSNTQVGNGIAEKYTIVKGQGISNLIDVLAIDVSIVSVIDLESNNNPTGLFYYALATPTNTEITDTTLIEQLEALNNAMAFDGQNNISSECEIGNALARIKATFMIKGGV